MGTSYFPDPPSDSPVVSGGTTGDGGVITATATTVAMSTTVHPLWICGTAGTLTWSVTVTGDADLDNVTFTMTIGASRRQVARTSSGAFSSTAFGPDFHTEATPIGRSASAVLQLRALTPDVVLSLVVHCPIGTHLTVSQRWAQTPSIDSQVVLAEPGSADASPNGVIPPPPSNALSAREADTPARRSPQVRAAQRKGVLRPDLLPRQSSLV